MSTSGTEIALGGLAGPSLIRAIGRWSLTAAVVNCVIGSGIFGLPSALAGLVGVWSPLVVLFAGCSIFIIVLCFAEVGSRFEDAGGPYLYAREAFGPAVGFQVGWLHLWTRVLSGAAVLNVLVEYLGAIVPGVQTPEGRAVAMTGGMALVTATNITGVRNATWAVNVFTVAKLLPLCLLILLGTFHLRPEVFATQVVSTPNWPEAVLLLVFAYGGFESAVIAASETRNPRGDTAFALITAMAAVTVVYCLVQIAVLGVLPHAAQSATPIASALGELLGATGSAIGSLAVVVSVYGWLTGFALLTPRILLSMANRNELPAVFASVHSRFRTPHISIAINSVIVLVLGLSSTFTQAATLSAISRLGIFVCTCAALLSFRGQARQSSGFRLPGGRVVALTSIAFCLWLLSTRSFAQAWILFAMMAAGALLWAGGRNGWFTLGAVRGTGEAP